MSREGPLRKFLRGERILSGQRRIGEVTRAGLLSRLDAAIQDEQMAQKEYLSLMDDLKNLGSSVTTVEEETLAVAWGTVVGIRSDEQRHERELTKIRDAVQ